METELLSSIVRKALAPEPVNADGQLPVETPIAERLRLLNNALGSTGGQVAEQQRKLEALKKEIEDYRNLVNKMKDRAVEAERLAKLMPEPAPAPQAAPQVLEPAVEAVAVVEAALPVVPDLPVPLQLVLDPVETVPSFASEPVLVQIPAATRAPYAPHPWSRYAPFAALAGLALLLNVDYQRGQAQMPALSFIEDSPRALPPVDVVSVPSSPTVDEELTDQDVIALVQDFTPAGWARSVGEILAPDFENPASDQPWTITRVDAQTTLVSFRPYGDVLETGPIYEFSVDPKTRAVSPSPETLANLRGGDFAAAR